MTPFSSLAVFFFFLIVFSTFACRVSIVTFLPMIISYESQNFVISELVDLIHGNNIASLNDAVCDYMGDFVRSWLFTAESMQPDSKILRTNIHLLWARVLPYRDGCDWQMPDGVITFCSSNSSLSSVDSCQLWQESSQVNTGPIDLDNLKRYFSKELGIREGGIRTVTRCFPVATNPCGVQTDVLFNDNFTVSFT